jgi:molybdopterin synthase catalytic subunit
MKKNIFVNGAISPQFISETITAHQTKTTIGAHSIFLGQVRKDKTDNRNIVAIEYTSYDAMALEQMHIIRESVIDQYGLSCLHVYHSLGLIKTGDICLFVFASAPHRKAAIDGCAETVERLKVELPIWGKEIFEDDSFQWKVNKPA